MDVCVALLRLRREDSQSHRHSLRESFNGVRYIVRTGNQWRYMPNNLSPWSAVCQQMRRWLDAGVFEVLVPDVQSLLSEFGERKGQPTAVCLASCTLQSMPEPGARVGCGGAMRRRGSIVHIAVDTLGHLTALKITPPAYRLSGAALVNLVVTGPQFIPACRVRHFTQRGKWPSGLPLGSGKARRVSGYLLRRARMISTSKSGIGIAPYS